MFLALTAATKATLFTTGKILVACAPVFMALHNYVVSKKTERNR